MKESIRNTKSRDELSENSKDIRRNSGNALIYLKNKIVGLPREPTMTISVLIMIKYERKV